MVSVNSDSQCITFDWSLYYYSPDDSVPSTSDCPDVNIYLTSAYLQGHRNCCVQLRRTLLRREGSAQIANNDVLTPVLTIIATDYQVGDDGFRFNSLAFRTEVAMFNIIPISRRAESDHFDE